MGSVEFKEAIWEQIDEFKADEIEIRLRMTNLIFKGITESRTYEEDCQEVEEILKDLEIKEASIKSVTRLNPSCGAQQSNNQITYSNNEV